LDGEGFLYEVDPLVQHTAVGDDVRSVAGHEQGLDIGAELLHLIGQFPAVHHGHDHVGDEQVDAAGMLPGSETTDHRLYL
jgi:hypothetical protein